MKKLFKILLIIGGILMVGGIGITVAGLASADFDMNRISYPQNEFEKKTVEYDKDFKRLDVKTIDDNIEIKKSDDEKTRIEYYISKDEKITYKFHTDNDLKVVQDDNREWYDRISFFKEEKDHSLTIYIPKESYEKYSLYSVTGNISSDIPLDIKGYVNISTINGNINAKNIKAEKEITTDSVSGNIKIDNFISGEQAETHNTSGKIIINGYKADKFSIYSVSGDLKIENTVSEGVMNIKTVSGNIYLDKTNDPIKLETTSGDIKGSIGYDGIYTANTISGDVNMPASSKSGNKYEFKTVSGDIDLS